MAASQDGLSACLDFLMAAISPAAERSRSLTAGRRIVVLSRVD
jgi:hypothetical protein